MMRISTGLATVIVTLSLALTVGCGDSPELRIQQAQIALANGRPDRALDIVSGVLDQRPDDTKALLLKARAQTLLAQLDDSKKTLDKLIEAEPENLDARLHLVDWTWFRIRSVLSQSDFSSNPDLQAQFDEAMSVGRAQAEWLINRQKRVADAHYFQARYALFDIGRLRTLAQAQKKLVGNISLLDRSAGGDSDVVAAQLEVQIEARMDDADGHLVEAIRVEPNHFQAIKARAELLAQRQQWGGLWALAAKAADAQEGIPVDTAQQLVLALLAMPSSEQPLDGRLKVCRQIQSAVKKPAQRSAVWKLTSARLHLVANEPAQAKPLLESVLQSRPNEADAQFLLAQALYGLKEFEQARNIIEKLATKASRSPRVQALYGLVLMQLKETILAKEALRRATDLDPNDAIAREAFLALMAQEGHIEQAEADIEQYLNRNPSDPRAIRFKMQYEQSQGRPQEVAKLLQRVEAMYPLTDEHLSILIDGFKVIQQYDKVEKYARRLARSRPDSIDSHLRLAEALLMAGKDEDMKQLLIQLREKFPEAASLDKMLGRLYLHRQWYDRALEALERSVEEDPKDVDCRIMLAQALAGLSLIDEALEQIDLVIEQDPGEVRAHALASRINQVAGRTEKANEHLAQIDEGRINEATSPALLAQIKIKKGQLEDATAICNRAIVAGNNDPVLRMLLAGIYIKRQEPDRAEEHLLGLVRSQPDNPQAYLLLGRFYADQDRIDRGLGELQKLQLLNEPLVRLTEASLLARAGRLDEAKQKLEPIYDPLIRARSPLAMAIADALMRIYGKLGDMEAATAVYEPMIKADLRAGDARLRQIDLTATRDRFDQTIEALNALAAQLTPDQHRLRYQVIARYRRLGQIDRALELLGQWLANEPQQPSLLRWKGELLLAQGRSPEAIDALQAAVTAAPETPILRLLLAQAHVTNLDYPSAEAVLLETAQLDSGARISALASLGRMFLALGLNRKAAQVFDELERHGRPSDPRLIYAMGQAYAGLRQDDLARQRLEEVPPYASQYAVAQLLLSRVEQRNGMLEQSKKRLEDLARDPRTAAAAAQELLALNVRNAQDESLIKWCDRVLSIESLSPQMKLGWLSVRAKVAARARNWARLHSVLEQMSQLEPDSQQLLASRIVVMLQLNMLEQARQSYRLDASLAASELGPAIAILVGEEPQQVADRPELYQYFESLASGDVDAARSAAQALPPMQGYYRSDLLAVLDRPDVASRSMSDSFRFLVGAMVAIRCGLPELADDLSQRVTGPMPLLVPAQSLRARALLDMNQPIDPVLEGIRRDPSSSLTLLLRSMDHTQNKEFTEAVAILRQLIQKEPENIHLRYQLAQRLQQADRVDEAIEVLEAIAAEESPYKPLAENDLAYILAENQPDRIDEAYELAQKAIKRSSAQNFALMDTLGWIEHLRGQDDQALVHLAQAAKGLSGMPEVHYHLGVVYRAHGNATWARYHLEQAAAGPADRPDVGKAKAALENLET